ncbi:membrane protein insertion efficiency factor YidD [Aurantivibrio plasticivorans]
MDRLFIYLINIYKRRISPHKGFSCAHRVLYGQESCSSYVKSSIKIYGWRKAISLIPERAKACSHAAKTLEENNGKPKRRKRDDESWYAYCLGEVVGNAACCFIFN